MTRTNPHMLPRNQGFSLIELMVALAIGLFLIAGVFAVYVNGNRSQKTVDEQVDMVDNARFALEAISADVRQAGVYGRVTKAFQVNHSTMPAIANECVAGWTNDVSNPVMAFNDQDPYGAPCISNYSQGDVLVLRGSLRDPVAALQNNRLYINSDANNAQFFYGTASPSLTASASDYEYYASAYYISSFSDNPTDGIPSLHRISLQPGGTVIDQLLLSGVEDMQVQIGLVNDDNDDGAPDRISYVDPPVSTSTDWSSAKSVQIWLVIRPSAATHAGMDTTLSTNIAGQPVTFADDGIRRVVVSTVANLREL